MFCVEHVELLPVYLYSILPVCFFAPIPTLLSRERADTFDEPWETTDAFIIVYGRLETKALYSPLFSNISLLDSAQFSGLRKISLARGNNNKMPTTTCDTTVYNVVKIETREYGQFF